MSVYVKLDGSNKKEGIKALEKLAVDMHELCIWNVDIESNMPLFNSQTGTMEYFAAVPGLDSKRCDTIVAKSPVELRGNDFVFEWFGKPTNAQVDALKLKISETLSPLKLKYKLTVS